MRLIRGILVALLWLACAPALGAAPADDIKALIDKGDARGAYELGRKHPDQLGNPPFDFHFGIAAIDSGRAGEGVLALERYLIHFPDNFRARLELARGYFILGEDARAREEFSLVLQAKPPGAVVAHIERYLDAIRAREAAYRTTAGAFIEFGVGRDTNINGGVSSAGIVLPNLGLVTVAAPGVRTRAGFGHLAGGASIVHPVAPGIALQGSVAGDLKAHDTHGEFDQRSLSASGGVSYLRERNLFRAMLSLATLDVDYRRFRDVAGLSGEWIHQLDELQSVNGFLQYAELDYAGANDVRDSRLSGAGIGYRRALIGPWRPLLALSMSYAREDNRRNRDDLGRDIVGLRAAVGATPAPRWSLSAGATLQRSNYQERDFLFGATRRDNYYAVDLTAGYALTRALSIRGEVLVSKNDSNIALFEYKREVAAVKVRHEFK